MLNLNPRPKRSRQRIAPKSHRSLGSIIEDGVKYVSLNGNNASLPRNPERAKPPPNASHRNAPKQTEIATHRT
jgi:hypothetical protein